ncbi:hypothetical protein Jden_2314 [Jonesia denitrificans DSM 20603]|uniref:HK97 gp10 family phage protein n=2 Tax=Jonesia TaxID=43673 RepID=C7R261_JONDD|nr:hypothetical protein [Jonesia denitrificans]ACV09949.1 hypothetical protein Jden_2314 [Jonesia denitrificans DSM 20603]ASE08812.1 hypothetical protein CEP80_06445 [Jonesia denitrificans]ASE08869.1 hypothetical protein CEP80_06745 [Jonesia denitrificans]SQH22712.1 Uncharacterised protein [Jonesia denitrificans]
MGSRVKVKMNSAGAARVMNSAGVQARLLAHAESMAAAANSMLDPASAGAGRFEADVKPGKVRAHARVTAAGVYPIRHNLKHNTLLKVLGNG